jgi:hypothetical protein
MITNTASHISPARYEQENQLALRATAEMKKSGHRLLKWFGALSTALLCAAALAPNVSGIPAGLHPWVFLTAIFWSFAFCAGMFDL